MEIDDEDAAALLAELKANVRQHGDIDRMQYAESEGISHSAAAERLGKLVKVGVLVDVGRIWDPDKRAWMHCWRRKFSPIVPISTMR